MNTKVYYLDKLLYKIENICPDVKAKAYSNALLKFSIHKGTSPSKLYKFKNIDKRTINIIKDAEFYFSSPLNFNDPFDCNLFYKEEYNPDEIDLAFNRFVKRNPQMTKEKMIQEVGYDSKKFYDFYSMINNKMIKDSGILSLSKKVNNITMWSHYADNHKGLAFELDLKKDLDFFSLFGPVDYKDEYDILSYSKDNKEELIKLFLIKYTDWEYEKEVRIIDTDKNGSRKFKKEVLKTIIFGCKTNIKYMKSIIKLCNKNEFKHVKFKKAKIVPGKFELEFDEIKKEDFF